jgi:hypothetical protein
MHKENAQKLFDTFFDSKKAIIKYFGASKVDISNYEFSQWDEVWDFVGGCDCKASQCKPDRVIWAQGEAPDGKPLPLSSDECGYESHISHSGVFETEDFTLVFTDRGAHPKAAFIFDNSLRFKR